MVFGGSKNLLQKVIGPLELRKSAAGPFLILWILWASESGKGPLHCRGNPTETGWPHRLQEKRLGLLPPWIPKWTWDGAASHPTSGKMPDVPTMFPRPLWPGISLGMLEDFAFWLGCLGWCFGRRGSLCVLLGCLGLFCCQDFRVLEVRQTYRRPLRQNQGTKGPGVMHQVHRPFLNMNAKVQSPLFMTACSTTTITSAKISFLCLKLPLAAESTACPRIQATSCVFPSSWASKGLRAPPPTEGQGEMGKGGDGAACTVPNLWWYLTDRCEVARLIG